MDFALTPSFYISVLLNSGSHDCVAITLVSKPCSFPQIIVFLRNTHVKVYVANYI